MPFERNRSALGGFQIVLGGPSSRPRWQSPRRLHLGNRRLRSAAADLRRQYLTRESTENVVAEGPKRLRHQEACQHYEPLIEGAERRAAEADRLAEYHRFRASELQEQ